MTTLTDIKARFAAGPDAFLDLVPLDVVAATEPADLDDLVCAVGSVWVRSTTTGDTGILQGVDTRGLAVLWLYRSAGADGTTTEWLDDLVDVTDGFWVYVDSTVTGEPAYAFPAVEDQLDARVHAELTRWSPDHVVEVVPFGAVEAVRSERCTGTATGMS